MKTQIKAFKILIDRHFFKNSRYPSRLSTKAVISPDQSIAELKTPSPKVLLRSEAVHPSAFWFCQLSGIKGNYRAPQPPTQVRVMLGGSAFLHAFNPQRYVGGRPEPDDGLVFSIGANSTDQRPIENWGPSRPTCRRVRQSGGMTRYQRGKPLEGGPLERSAPSALPFRAEFARRRQFPDWWNQFPRPSIGRSGRWEWEFG